ncbi:MAG TPA: MFS transporter [Chloroflexia bacterium]|jgi:MFS family permease
MERPVDASAYTQPVAVVPEPTVPEAEHVQSESFDAGKAVRFSVANFGTQAVFTLFTTGMSLYLETYKIRPELIGLLSNERAFVAAIAQPIVGRMSDRTRTRLGRRRPFFLVGIPAISVALAILATHPPFWVMLGIMTFAAFFLWVALDPYNAMLADIFPPSHRGRVGGILGLTQMLGSIVFLLFAINFWKDNEPLVFGVTIAVLLLSFGFTFFTVKEPPLNTQAEERAARPAKLTPIAYIKDLLVHKEAAKYTLALVFFWIGNGGATPLLTLFGTHALGANSSEVFFLPLAFVITTAIFAVPAGFLADRIGKKRVMTFGLFLFGAGAIIGSQSADLIQGTIALAFIGIGNAGIGTMLIPFLTDLIPRSRTAELIGISSAVTSFAQPVGSVLAGGVVSLTTSMVGLSDAYRWSFIFSGVMIVVGGLFLQRVRPEQFVQES